MTGRNLQAELDEMRQRLDLVLREASDTIVRQRKQIDILQARVRVLLDLAPEPAGGDTIHYPISSAAPVRQRKDNVLAMRETRPGWPHGVCKATAGRYVAARNLFDEGFWVGEVEFDRPAEARRYVDQRLEKLIGEIGIFDDRGRCLAYHVRRSTRSESV